MDHRPMLGIAAVLSSLAVAACGSDVLVLPQSEIIELDAGFLSTMAMDPHDAVDLESEGHELVVLDRMPEVGLPEDNVVAAADVPAHVLRVLREQTIEKAIVGDVDSRALISNSRVAPYSAVSQVLVQWYAGAEAIPCTGTLVSRDAVLTAAHCLYNSKRTATGFPYSVSVVPGLYPKNPLPTTGVQFNAPFGVGHAKKLFVPDGFKATDRQAWARIPFDYAIIRLKAPIAKASVRAIGALPDALSQPTVLDAYHEDKNRCRQMYRSKDRVRKLIDDGSFNHFTDLKPGASGGGIVGSGAWANKIFAVQSAHIDDGNRYNIAATITEAKLRTISSWVNRAL